MFQYKILYFSTFHKISACTKKKKKSNKEIKEKYGVLLILIDF